MSNARTIWLVIVPTVAIHLAMWMLIRAENRRAGATVIFEDNKVSAIEMKVRQ